MIEHTHIYEKLDVIVWVLAAGCGLLFVTVVRLLSLNEDQHFWPRRNKQDPAKTQEALRREELESDLQYAADLLHRLSPHLNQLSGSEDQVRGYLYGESMDASDPARMVWEIRRALSAYERTRRFLPSLGKGDRRE